MLSSRTIVPTTTRKISRETPTQIPNSYTPRRNNTPLDDQMTRKTAKRKQKRDSSSIQVSAENLHKATNDILREPNQRRQLSRNIRHGYTVLGIILICIGIGMPSYLYYEALIPVTYPTKSSSQPPPPSTGCTVVTTTLTGENGAVHRLFNVTCSETLHISAILDTPNATLPSSAQSLLSNVSYTISVVSTIATVAVALAIVPFQGEDYAKLKSRTTFPLVATCFLSMALVLALFLILAHPLNAISPGYALCVVLLMLASTLVGYGFSIVSWGSLKAVDHSKNSMSVEDK